jgi:hypothetical protein
MMAEMVFSHCLHPMWNARSDPNSPGYDLCGLRSDPIPKSNNAVVGEKRSSGSFDPGGYAIPMAATGIRLGPGTNYASIGTAQEEAIGVFQDHSNQLM